MRKLLILLFLILLLLIGCFPYMYHTRDKVLLENIDIDATLEIAVIELTEGGFDAVLTIWALRDQIINPEQAGRINQIYLDYIEKVAAEKKRNIAEFGVWHLAWAISNLYRNGNDMIKNKLEAAYKDAKMRPATLEKFKQIADRHINGNKLYMGDVHQLGRYYATTHLVIPGNKKYVQSLEDFRKWKKEQ